jgi:hypothetical protein
MPAPCVEPSAAGYLRHQVRRVDDALKGAWGAVDSEGVVEMTATEHFVHGSTGDRLTAETLGGDVILVERRMSAGGWELGSVERLPRRRGRQAMIDRFLGRDRRRRRAASAAR